MVLSRYQGQRISINRIDILLFMVTGVHILCLIEASYIHTYATSESSRFQAMTKDMTKDE